MTTGEPAEARPQGRSKRKAALIVLGLLAVLALAVLPLILFQGGTPGRKVTSVEVTVKNLSFPKWKETHVLKMGKPEIIHDTDLWLRLDDFVSDYYMDLDTKEVRSRSDELKLAAVRLTLGDRDKQIYTAWFVKGAETQHQVRPGGFIYEIGEIRR